jgi:hypothetical protein
MTEGTIQQGPGSQNGQSNGNGGNKPVLEVRAGGIKAAAWERQRTSGDRTFTVYSVKLERRYKDQNGQWNGSALNLSEQQLAAAELVLRKLREELRVRVMGGVQDQGNGGQ